MSRFRVVADHLPGVTAKHLREITVEDVESDDPSARKRIKITMTALPRSSNAVVQVARDLVDQGHCMETERLAAVQLEAVENYLAVSICDFCVLYKARSILADFLAESNASTSRSQK